MSYILDALKKSEQERGRGNTPGVQTVHSASINYHNEKKSYWPYILITAVILNLIAIIYFIVDKEKKTDDDTEVTKNINVEKQNDKIFKKTDEQSKTITKEKNLLKNVAKVDNTPPAPITTPVATSPKTNNDFKPAIPDTQDKIKPVQTEEPSSDVIDYHDLHDSIKLQLPTITISAHVYSSNPAQRSIVINNNFLEEGERLIDDMVLHEITPDGAILNYQGTLFHYGVVSSWQ